MRSLILRLAGFTGAPILSALAPFIILPLVSRIVGAEGWANFSAGQSIGILGMVGVLFGWSVMGPVRVARAQDSTERAVILHESLRSRVVTATVAIPLAGVATWCVSSDAYRAESVAVAIAMTVGGFTPAWFCIGEGNPRGVMIFDALPKLAASLLALPLIAATGAVMWYPVLLLAVTVPAFALHARRAAHSDLRRDAELRPVRSVLRTLVPTAAIDAAGNAYGSTAIPIATAGLPPTEASAFASADRAYRIALMAVIALGNAFQAWVLTPAADDPARRQRLALVSHVVLGIVGGLGIALLGPLLTGVLFGSAVAAQPIPSLFYGIAFFFLSSTTPLSRNILIPAHRFRIVFAATIASAAVGITTMVIGATAGSASVVAMGVAAAEGTSFILLLVPARRAFPAVIAAARPPVPPST